MSYPQYADDIQLYHTIPSNPKAAIDTFNPGLEVIMRWVWENKLALNPDKMEVLMVSHNSSPGSGVTPVVGRALLPLKPEIRSLGVLLDPLLPL